MTVAERECTLCRRVKPAAAFKARPDRSCGLDSWCRPCRQRYQRRLAKRPELARLHTYVDAAPVRRHVQALIDGGVSVHQLQCHSGVNRGSIRHILGLSKRATPAVRVRAETAAALLAVRPRPGDPAPGARVDGTGTRRRIEALLAIGWPARELALRLGAATPYLQAARHPTVLYSTAVAVRALYDELSGQPGPSARSAKLWRGRGCLVPAWWDDDTIDDPAFVPDTRVRAGDRYVDDASAPRVDRVHHLHGLGWSVPRIAAALEVTTKTVRRDLREYRPTLTLDITPVDQDTLGVDEAAVLRRIAGDRHVKLTRAERVDAVTRLHARGLADTEIAAQLGYSDRTVLRYRQELGLPSNPTPHNSTVRVA